jgi:hypothetical protein
LNASVWKKTVADWKSGFMMAIECLYLGPCKRLTAFIVANDRSAGFI